VKIGIKASAQIWYTPRHRGTAKKLDDLSASLPLCVVLCFHGGSLNQDPPYVFVAFVL
jgi:hypothetical protein